MPASCKQADQVPSSSSRVISHLRRMYAVDERGLIVFRIAFGCVLIWDILERTGLVFLRPRDASCFYSDLGVETRADRTEWAFCLFCATGTPSVVWLLFLAGLYADFNIARGVNVQASALFSLFVHAGAYARMRRCSIGADVMANRCLFFIAVDPWLFGSRASHREDVASQDGKASRKKRRRNYAEVVSVGATALVLCQGLVYAGAGLAKSREAWMVSGMAIRDALESPFYGRRVQLVQWLLSQPSLIKLASQITVISEILVGVLALFPVLAPDVCRLLAFVSICGLHIGLTVCMRLGNFPFISIACAIPLLPSSVWNFIWPSKWSIHSEQQLSECDSQSRTYAQRISTALRIAACSLGLFWVTASLPTVLPKCEGAHGGFGCLLPEQILKGNWIRHIPYEREFRQVAEMFGLAPFSFDMFNIPRSDHGWFVVLGQEDESGRLISLPSESPVATAEEAFSRPSGSFPSMRWRQYWFAISESGSAAIKMREQFAGYYCRVPPGGKQLARIQMFWTPNLRKQHDTPVLDYPEARPSRIFNWFCTNDLVARWKSGNCTECETDIIHIPPLPKSIPAKSSKAAQVTASIATNRSSATEL